MRRPRPVTFKLTDREHEILRRPTRGGGGYQRELDELLGRIDEHGRVDFDDAQLGRLVRHGWFYGSGGYQSRIKAAFTRSLWELFGTA